MRLYTVEINNKENIAAEVNNGLCVLSDIGLDFPTMNDLIRKFTPELMAEITKKITSGKVFPIDSVKLLAPIPRPMHDIICLGVNYREHAAECDMEAGETAYFSKRAIYATAPNGIIPSHKGFADNIDYEAELGVIIGKDAFAVSEANALDYVFGYTVINDVSARNLQFKHNQWFFGKSLDGFTPMGPCIVTKDEIPDVQNLDISCHVNGELRQSSNTSRMIRTIAGAIAELSKGMTLEAGTIISSGTPSGVALGMSDPKYLKHGDTVVCEVEGIGKLSNTVE